MSFEAQVPADVEGVHSAAMAFVTSDDPAELCALMTEVYRENSAIGAEGDPVNDCVGAVARALEVRERVPHQVLTIQGTEERADAWVVAGEEAGTMVLHLIRREGTWVIDGITME